MRKAMIEGEVVDCMIALPGQLFDSTRFRPAFGFWRRTNPEPGIARDRKLRDRRGEVLFIDARKLGFMVDRTRKEFPDADITQIAEKDHAWRLGEGYADIPGFCKSASIEEIRAHGHVLTPGCYVGLQAAEEDDTPFAECFAGLQDQLEAQFAEAEALRRLSGRGWRGLGFE